MQSADAFTAKGHGFYGSPFSAVIAALVFLYLGFSFFAGEWEGPELDLRAIALLRWTTRVAGVGLLLVAGMSAAQLAAANVVDALISGFATLGCLGGGGLLAYLGYPSGFLILLLGLMSAHAAWAALQRERARRAARAAGAKLDEPTP